VLPTDTADEIGMLSTAFNTMTAKIQEYTSGLENKVRERTKELQDANTSIMDSLAYARLIQESLLPSGTSISAAAGPRAGAELALINKPRDLVGGDFIYFKPCADGFLAAVVDCTGHGVPGALMTMLAGSLLDRVVASLETVALVDAGPSELLSRFHVLLREALQAGNELEHFDNGLDIALCRLHAKENVLHFSGAGLPLYVATSDKVVEIAGDRVSLGYSSVPLGQKWTEHRIDLKEASTFYLISDGLLDLGGGDKGFGFGRARFIELLNTIQKMGLTDQKERVLATLQEYQGALKQRDDISFLAFRV